MSVIPCFRVGAIHIPKYFSGMKVKSIFGKTIYGYRMCFLISCPSLWRDFEVVSAEYVCNHEVHLMKYQQKKLAINSGDIFSDDKEISECQNATI